ncbi:MAG TPA: hypothetical protein VE690_20980 [Rhodopila sp.]|nr:hypothetical protein [Rhodopila sp.]
MTDRCSAEVAIPIQYDGHPDSAGTVILKRDAAGTTPWSPPIKVETDSDGHVRWWCHSTTGNWADAGTWRVSFNSDGVVGCLVAIGSTIASDGGAGGSLTACLKLVKLGSSAFKGWTPERSRCNDHSNVIRARLGPDRLLQTECLPAQKPVGQS